MKATIVNTKDWENHWFQDREGEVINVKPYRYKTTIGGYTDYCSCIDCVIARAGRQLFEAFQVVETGSIIPICCLEFD